MAVDYALVSHLCQWVGVDPFGPKPRPSTSRRFWHGCCVTSRSPVPLQGHHLLCAGAGARIAGTPQWAIDWTVASPVLSNAKKASAFGRCGARLGPLAERRFPNAPLNERSNTTIGRHDCSTQGLPCALGTYPTPLQTLERLSKALGAPAYWSNDDMTGLAWRTRRANSATCWPMRSNKALYHFTMGAPQSNHARQQPQQQRTTVWERCCVDAACPAHPLGTCC